MEPATLGVVLDSSVVIEGGRRHLNVAQFLKQIVPRIGETEVALCSITVAELAHGIHRADTPERRQRRRVTIPLDDLLIGASALQRGYAVATRDVRHFQKIPGLRRISL
jgi:hypothetical protein